ncbi:AraC family transcriptional regulator [Sphingobium lactosutens]|uniref:helix-turn-helix domain-containing protein n=1 Tax=Sphingobium lactosutens TaxID=522773 RepID=UPI0015BAC0D2|nr:helix-turn-helix domain-containing protein [Sphingobium lactosutens]NWK94460.1 AraC family transcriptional regulator [Sphingobium lactosutens]
MLQVRDGRERLLADTARVTLALFALAQRYAAFVHAEALDDRSRPSEWTIQPHSHSELVHIFVIGSGGGAMQADGKELCFSAPCMIFVPAIAVHGFDWLRDTEGSVLTMATRYVGEQARHDRDLLGLFESPSAVKLSERESGRIAMLTDDIMREFSWSAPGHRSAVDAAIQSFLVLGLLHLDPESRVRPTPGMHAATVARLRERIEQRLRFREPVSGYASALGLSQTALRVACAKVAGQSPGQMLDARALLEARRSLIYSNLPVAATGFSLGFSDPAYFSRFFQRKMGMSPHELVVSHLMV